MPKFLTISDEKTVCFRWSVTNETLTCQLALCQFVICVVSLSQHIFSWMRYGNVFLCRFNNGPEDEYSSFLAYDIIIFDFGLFHKILGVPTCIANHLDGGYMRCLWCIGHTIAIIILLVMPCLDRTAPPWLLWPMLTMESAYCLGLIIFTIATTDKLVHAVLHDLSGQLVWLAVIYWIGAATNCFLDYVLWHFYWHMEEMYKQRKSARATGEIGTGEIDKRRKRSQEENEQCKTLVILQSENEDDFENCDETSSSDVIQTRTAKSDSREKMIISHNRNRYGAKPVAV